MNPLRARHAAAALVLLLSGCATTGTGVPGDPFERVNRGVHRFNHAVDRAVLKPVAKGYRKFVPRVVRTGIGNVLSNLAFPTTIVNDLLQLKLVDAAADVGRFALNSTLGLGGLLDPATDAGIRRNSEDFGQTLGRWGVPAGPYLVLPLLGPSTLRDAPALAADAQTDLRVQLDLEPDERIALGVMSIVDGRARLLSAEGALESAFDPYALIRNAWLKRREYLVRDGDVPEEALPEDFGQDEENLPPPEPEDQPPDEPSKSETSPIPASVVSAGGGLQ